MWQYTNLNPAKKMLAAVKSIQADMNEGKKSKWERGDNNAKPSV